MKKIISTILAVALTATIAIVPAQQKAQAATLSGTVKISGSTSVYPLAQALRESFKKKYPGVTIQFVNITGSGAGIADATKGTVDFGMSSRTLTTAEKKVLTPTGIALDGVAIVVNKDNSLTNISATQLGNIYTGAIKSWSDISPSVASLGSIGPVNRENGSGTRSCFEDVFKNDLGTDLTKNSFYMAVPAQSSTGGMQTQVAGSKGAIGYMSLGDVDSSKVNVLKFNNVVPSKESIANKTYEFSRTFFFARKTTKVVSAQAQAFLNYILSAEGQTIVDAKGFVKLPTTSVAVTSVKLNKTSATLKVKSGLTLKATIAPTNASIKKVKYSSSNTKVAKVDALTGAVKAVKKGKATITVTTTSDNKKATCKITVK